MSLGTYLIHRWNYAPFWQALIISSLPIIIWVLLIVKASCRVMKLVSEVCMIVSIVAIIYITLLFRTQEKFPSMDLVPFTFIKRGLESPTVFREYWMNIYLFLPLGMTLPVFLKEKFWCIVLLGLALSMLIETIQFIFAIGLCETDDLIANTLGCFFGVEIYRMALLIKYKVTESVK